MRFAAPLFIAALFAWTPGAQTPPPSPIAPETPTQFVKVEVQILTAGEKRPVKEVGAFTASLPLGKPGKLERRLEIASTAQGTKAEAVLRLVLTPSQDDSGLLHCLVLSESTLAGQAPETRMKDMTFPHPGSQVMDLLSDPATTTRIILSVSAQLVETPAPPPTWPPIRFGLRVEHWLGNSREGVEGVQLQSIEGQTVTHHYAKRIPKVVEGREEGGIVLEELPVVEEGKEGTNLKAGQSFVVKLAPDEKREKREKKRRQEEEKRPDVLPSPFLTAESPGTPQPPERPHTLVWDEEYYDITVTPLQLSKGGMRIQVTMEGQIFDPETGLLQEKLELLQEKEVLPGQPVPFYLTRELPGGPQGFVAWVLPYWETTN